MKTTVNEFLNDMLDEMLRMTSDEQGNEKVNDEFKAEATQWVKEHLLIEDRDIVIEDFNGQTGLVYKLIDAFLEMFNDKYDLGFSMWNISLEEYLRMSFAAEYATDGVKMLGDFSMDEMNKQMYGENYNK